MDLGSINLHLLRHSAMAPLLLSQKLHSWGSGHRWPGSDPPSGGHLATAAQHGQFCNTVTISNYQSRAVRRIRQAFLNKSSIEE